MLLKWNYWGFRSMALRWPAADVTLAVDQSNAFKQGVLHSTFDCLKLKKRKQPCLFFWCEESKRNHHQKWTNLMHIHKELRPGVCMRNSACSPFSSFLRFKPEPPSLLRSSLFWHKRGTSLLTTKTDQIEPRWSLLQVFDLSVSIFPRH